MVDWHLLQDAGVAPRDASRSARSIRVLTRRTAIGSRFVCTLPLLTLPSNSNCQFQNPGVADGTTVYGTPLWVIAGDIAAIPERDSDFQPFNDWLRFVVPQLGCDAMPPSAWLIGGPPRASRLQERGRTTIPGRTTVLTNRPLLQMPLQICLQAWQYPVTCSWLSPAATILFVSR